MSGEPQRQRMKLDLPEVYTRAIRVRAGLDGVNPRDVVTAALDEYLAGEIALVKKRLGNEGPEPDGSVAPPRRRRKGD
jgi:hypothetical protein